MQLLAQAEEAAPEVDTPAETDASPAEGSEAAAQPTTDEAATTDGATAEAPVAATVTETAASEVYETTTSTAEPWYGEMLKSGAMGYMLDGGFFMWPILIMAILGAGVIIERFRSLKMLRTDTEALRGQVLEHLQADRVEDALELCDGQQGPVPAILSTGLRKFLLHKRLGSDPAKIEEQVVKSMDDYGVHIVAALERHLPILATISSVAPMVGFLGTVQGMVISFADIVAMKGETNIVEAAAAGIMVALLTTVFGLIVGIPTFTAYNYFSSVINGFVLEVEESASELIEAVTLRMALGGDEPEPA